MECQNYVYRDFNLPHDYYGEIEITLLPDNKLHVQVNSLHQNYTMDYVIDCPAGQADVVVKYHENLELYTVITNIFNKITYDHRDYLYNNKKSTDLIHCFPEFVTDNPDLPYIERSETIGWALLEFTLENMKYVGVEKTDCNTNSGLRPSLLEKFSPENTPNDESIIIYGEVNKDGLFTYDYPIISREMDKKYYEMTRGHNVHRIKLDTKTLEYMIDPEFEENYQKFLDSISPIEKKKPWNSIVF